MDGFPPSLTGRLEQLGVLEKLRTSMMLWRSYPLVEDSFTKEEVTMVLGNDELALNFLEMAKEFAGNKLSAFKKAFPKCR